VGRRSFEVGTAQSQRGRGSIHHALDEFVNGASCHRLDRSEGTSLVLCFRYSVFVGHPQSPSRFTSLAGSPELV
jgi:hypothetical protein